MIKNITSKGEKGGECNRTNCTILGAHFFNKSTKKFYCERCAAAINWKGGRKDTLALYGTELLCEYEE